MLEVKGSGVEGERERDRRDRHSVTFSLKTVTEYLPPQSHSRIASGKFEVFRPSDVARDSVVAKATTN